MPKPRAKASKKKEPVVADGNATIGGRQLLVSSVDDVRRKRFIKRFEEMCEVIYQSNRDTQLLNSDGLNEIPTLAVGFVSRAMGLNLTNEQVLLLVEMIEDKEAASRGVVPAGRLRDVIIDGLITGLIGGPAVRGTAIPLDGTSLPINVIRDSEETIYQAFRVLDLSKRGYVEADEIRHFLRSAGEPFTEEEVEELIIAAADPENGRIYYEDFADVLATE